MKAEARPGTIMKRVRARALLHFFIPLLLLLSHGMEGAAESPLEKPGFAILAMMDLRPYVEAVEGVLSVLEASGADRVDVFDLRNYSGNTKDNLKQHLNKNGYALCVAVGPEAARFAADGQVPFVYTMILNPENVPGLAETSACGVSLRIPIRRQLAEIHEMLPEVHSVGLLFDRRYNDDFFANAGQLAGEYDLAIVPLAVASKKEIPKTLLQSWQKMDVLWFIPDETVISETLIQYINKEALLQKIPTIGFNSFFYENGSLLSFVFDYEILGRQAGELALSAVSGMPCTNASPLYDIRINERVMKRLEIRVAPGQGAIEEAAP